MITEAEDILVKDVAAATVGRIICRKNTSAKPLRCEGCRISDTDPKASVSFQGWLDQLDEFGRLARTVLSFSYRSNDCLKGCCLKAKELARDAFSTGYCYYQMQKPVEPPSTGNTKHWNNMQRWAVRHPEIDINAYFLLFPFPFYYAIHVMYPRCRIGNSSIS